MAMWFRDKCTPGGYHEVATIPKEENSMEVKIDADELCSLRSDLDRKMELIEERDWWREQSYRLSHLLDDERVLLNRDYSRNRNRFTSIAVGNLAARAADLGYGGH